MLLNDIVALFDLLDRPGKPANLVVSFLEAKGVKDVSLKTVKEKKGETDFIKFTIPGTHGKTNGGSAPTLGIIGRLGGLGARPDVIGFVSDGDGALAALAAGARLATMATNGDRLKGDVIIATHVCTNAPTMPHDPVPFMGLPIEIATMNKYEIDSAMDAILSVDTSRGNRIVNHVGFALSPTAKEGYILRMSDDLLSIMEQTTGKLPVTFPITTQDITPYGNGLYHFNSIMQPTTATSAPVVGVAITAEIPVAGTATGVTNAIQIDSVGRFVIEVAKRFGKNTCSFYDEKEYKKILSLYGSMKKLQKNPSSKQ